MYIKVVKIKSAKFFGDDNFKLYRVSLEQKLTI